MFLPFSKLKSPEGILIATILLFILSLSVCLLIYKYKLYEKGFSGAEKEKTMEEILQSLTAPENREKTEISAETLDSLTAPGKGEVSEDILNSLTAPK